MKDTLLYAVLFLLGILSGGEAIAQPYTIKRLGVEDGLSSNYVVDVAQDRKGYIWIATESGVSRFDGRQFNIYTKNNSDLSGNELNALFADPLEDKVWIGTQRDGLCYFDYSTETFTQFTAGKDSMLCDDITDLSPASDGGIWVTHYNYGVDYYDRETKKFTPYSSRDVQGLEGLNWVSMDDGDGHLYIGHHQRGMSIVSLKERTAKNFRHDPQNPHSIPSNEVRALCIDKNKNVWVGTDKGLALFNSQTGRFTTFRHMEGNEKSLLSDQVQDIKQMKDGTLWICTNMGGVSILNLQENTFTTPEKIGFYNIGVTNDNHGLSGPNARSIIQDSFGNIWIGNYRGGIDFISYAQPIFNTLSYTIEKQGKINNKQVWGMWADSNYRIWLGGEGELGVFQKGKKIKTFPLHECQLHPQTHINVIYEDRQQRLWLGTYKNGLLLYMPKDGSISRIGNKESEFLDVCYFYEDTDGKMWIGTQTGIYSSDGKELTDEKALNGQLPDLMVHGFLRDKGGKMWVGTFGKGVVIFDENGKRMLNFNTLNGLPSNAVNSMMQDSRQRIWVATRDGVIVFKDSSQPERFEHFGAKEGLENTQVRAIQEDHEGHIWISTNGGISRLDEKTKRFYNYNHHDGVPMGDFMDGSTCVSPDGILFFGSQNGACYFNPRELSAARDVSPVTITQFFIYNKQTESKDTELPIPITKGKVELPYNQNTFKISFNVLDYSQSSQLEFSYMLDGLEKVWYDTQGDNQVIFRNIPPGNYTFKVKTRFSNQEWDEDAAMLVVQINPPLWLTWYAKLFYALLFVLALYALLRFYKRKLDLESSLEVERRKSQNEQELNNERLRFYTNITHELRTPLTLILGPLEDLLSDTTLSPKHANKISIIHDSATRLLNLINRILEFRKTETQNRRLSVAKGDLGQLVQEVGLRYKELNPNPRVNYHIHIETNETQLFFDADMITIILDNLLSNAAKYTSQGDITLTLRTVEENLIKYTEISVGDTGHGILPDALPHIFDRYYQAKSKYQASGSGIGLALVKGLTELHEGTLKVESTPEVGTTFTLRLLTENAYPNAMHTQRKPENKSPETDEGTPGEAPVTDGRPLVLAVEDNADIREYIKSSFADIYDVIVAKDGQEGWEMAQARIPNIIVSDIMMPIMDGLELCKQVKDDMRTSHIPVILLTAKDSLQEKEEGYASGADSYLTKPFSAKLLHSRINNLLEARKKIAAQLADANTRHKQERAANSLNRLDNEFLQKITQVIEEHLDMEKMDIAFIADKMCMSHSTLYRKIKGLTDMSANEFIRKVKMRNGVILLLSGEYTISEISYMTGFSSVAYFRQCFKDEYGMSPSDYVKQNQ
ncbi:hybrid sensor histidine kinase/response regulator transcription factor [Phocaeicola sp.]